MLVPEAAVIPTARMYEWVVIRKIVALSDSKIVLVSCEFYI